MLFNIAAHTVQHFGQRVQKPGLAGKKCELKASNAASR